MPKPQAPYLDSIYLADEPDPLWDSEMPEELVPSSQPPLQRDNRAMAIHALRQKKKTKKRAPEADNIVANIKKAQAKNDPYREARLSLYKKAAWLPHGQLGTAALHANALPPELADEIQRELPGEYENLSFRGFMIDDPDKLSPEEQEVLVNWLQRRQQMAEEAVKNDPDVLKAKAGSY